MRISRIKPSSYFCSNSFYLTLILAIQILSSSLAFGARILIVHPLYSGSHVLTLRSVAESLTQRGHHVHILRWRDAHTFPAVNNANITETLLSMNNEHGYWKFLSAEKAAAFKMPYEILWNSGLSYKSIVEAGGEAFPLMKAQCDTLLGNQELIQELRQTQYDIAIIDILYNECGLALLNHLRIPSVGYWAFPFASGEADYTTAFLPASHVPAFMSRLTHDMNFIDRTYNVLMKIGSHLTMQIQCFMVNRSVQKYLPGSPCPCDLLKDMNGMLINTDYSMDYPRLLPPTFINVGGMQIRQPRPLPTDIENWMESSGDHGVVLFTMGFIFNPQVVPKRLVNSFMEAFSRLPQKFLVKFEGPIDFVPPNVKVLEWIPQQDVLAHSKTKVFLTHCGLHGVMEAIYYGVPMVGMPIFIDQGDALIKLKEKGIALGFDKDTATADEIYAALHEVIYNPKFKQNIEKLSLLMKDVQEPPLNRVMYFMEYLIRHKGAEHLKLSSRHLNFVQYFCLDTLAFLTVILVSLSYVQFLVLKVICKKMGTYLKDILICRVIQRNKSNNQCNVTNNNVIPNQSDRQNSNNNILSNSIKNNINNNNLRLTNGSYVKEVVNRIQKGEKSFSDYVTEYSNYDLKKRL